MCRAEISDVFVGWHVIVAHMYLRPCQLLALCLVLIPNSGYQIDWVSRSRCPIKPKKNQFNVAFFCSDRQTRPEDDKMLSRGLGRQIPALHERRRLWDMLLKVWPQWGLFLSFSLLSNVDHMTTCSSKFDHSEETFFFLPHTFQIFITMKYFVFFSKIGPKKGFYYSESSFYFVFAGMLTYLLMLECWPRSFVLSMLEYWTSSSFLFVSSWMLTKLFRSPADTSRLLVKKEDVPHWVRESYEWHQVNLLSLL